MAIAVITFDREQLYFSQKVGPVTAFCTVYSVFDVSLVGYPFHFTVFAYLVKGRVHEVYFFELIVFASVPYVLRESVHIFYVVCDTF